MNLDQRLHDIRHLYLQQFKDTMQELAAKSDEPLFLEAVLRTEDGELAIEGELQTPMRVDIVDGDSDIHYVDSDEQVGFPPLLDQLPGEPPMPLMLHPFTWDACLVTLTGLGDTPDWQPALDWLADWFDPEDEKEPDILGLYGVVHALADPVRDEAGNWTLILDLGTAPVEALTDWFSTCRELGAESITLGESTGGELDDAAE